MRRLRRLLARFFDAFRTKEERGAILLDDMSPGWYTLVDVDELDIWNAEKCILGQVYGDYFTGREALGIASVSPFGFADGDRDAWIREIEKRL